MLISVQNGSGQALKSLLTSHDSLIDEFFAESWVIKQLFKNKMASTKPSMEPNF